MTDKQSITEDDLFHTTWHNAREDGVPLQFAIGLRTVNKDEALSKIQKLNDGLKALKELPIYKEDYTKLCENFYKLNEKCIDMNTENQKLKAEIERITSVSIEEREYRERVEVENVQLKQLCDECNDKDGIFYFTKDKKLEDSQPCGKCNSQALEIVKKLKIYEKMHFLVLNNRPLNSDKLNLNLDGETILNALELKKRLEEEIDLRNYASSDCQMEIKEILQSILKGEKI